MSHFKYTYTAAYCSLLSVYIYFVVHGNINVQIVLKTLCSLGFVTAHVKCPVRHTTAAKLLLAGGVFGVLGDVLLAVGTHPYLASSAELLLVGGAIFFALGHFCYVSLLTLYVPLNVRTITLSTTITGACIMLFRALGFVYGDLEAPAYLYFFIVTFMMSHAVTTASVNTRTTFLTLPMFACGAALFWFSDVVIYYIHFGHASGPAVDAVNLVSYFMGQFLIHFSMLYKARCIW